MKKKALILLVPLILALTTVYTQIQAHRVLFLETAQSQRHREVIQNGARNPWQYRVLSEWCLKLVLPKDSSPVRAFIAFRIFQNFLIFFLAAAFYRKLGLKGGEILLGLLLLGWGMSYAFRDSDLEFSTYSEAIFYLLAALLILSRRDWWIPPLTFLAALNRETSVFIPFLFLACRTEFDGKKPKVRLRSIAIFILSAALYFSVYFGLRFLLGWRSFVERWGEPGIIRFCSNLKNPLAWQNIFLTVNILPFFCIFGLKRWPKILKRTFVGLIIPWLLIHYYGKACPDETRFLLVPLIIGFIPGALWFCFSIKGRIEEAKEDNRQPQQEES